MIVVNIARSVIKSRYVLLNSQELKEKYFNKIRGDENKLENIIKSK